MINFVKKSDVTTLFAPNAVASGGGALVGVIFGVATAAYANGAEGEFSREGEHDLTKVTAQAWTQGAKVYWDNAAKNCTTVVGTNLLIGAATLPAAASDVVGRVLLDGAIR